MKEGQKGLHMNIQDLRDSIDNIDSEILALLSERFKLTEMVGVTSNSFRVCFTDI